MSRVDTMSAEQLLAQVEILERGTGIAAMTRGDHQACLTACRDLSDTVRRFVALREDAAREQAIRDRVTQAPAEG